MLIPVKMLETLYEATPEGWKEYQQGNTYLIDEVMAENIYRAGAGVITIKIGDFKL